MICLSCHLVSFSLNCVLLIHHYYIAVNQPALIFEIGVVIGLSFFTSMWKGSYKLSLQNSSVKRLTEYVLVDFFGTM
jgi:hypothetical protein